MDFIDFTIVFTIIYNIALIGCIFAGMYKLFIYLFNLKNDEFTFLDFVLTFLTFYVVGYLLFPYLLIVIFDLIMYIFYIIITTFLPETGFLTLFIPLRELLMKIPPLETFDERGIFRLFTSIFKFFGMFHRLINGLKFIFWEYYLFSKNNTYELIKLFNPYINIEKFSNVVENMNNYNKKSELNNINNDIDVCIGSSSELTTPDMNYLNILKNDIGEMKTKFKCNLKTIPAYIST
jgi:hypothetical protein